MTAIVASVGPAAGSAHALYDYLKAHGIDHTQAMTDLVTAFQQAAGGDQNSVGLHGSVPVTGRYDAATSAALTIYTGQPIPPDPSAPPNTSPDAAPGWSLSSANLYAYLAVHPKPKGMTATQRSAADSTLKTLVKSFQHDVNTDPQFPGPAAKPPTMKVVTAPLTEDGIFGPNTAKVLAMVTLSPMAT
jgi:hypothetical protein